MNAGDYVQWNQPSPASLAAGDAPGFNWDDMSHQTGLSHQRSQVKLSDVTDGPQHVSWGRNTSTATITPMAAIGATPRACTVAAIESCFVGPDTWARLATRRRRTDRPWPRRAATSNGSACAAPAGIQHVVLRRLGADGQLLDRRRDLPPVGQPQGRAANRRQACLKWSVVGWGLAHLRMVVGVANMSLWGQSSMVDSPSAWLNAENFRSPGLAISGE